MTKKETLFIIIQLVFAGIGGFLIADVRLVVGIFFLMWSNNLGRIK